MPRDPYAPCPCGSGKKFKWCCQPIHVQIDKAFQQDADGQHEAAMRTMEEVIKDHGTNPEVWGRKAQLLFSNERAEEAELALDKAMELNPSYPLGLYLRGRFRHFEGEVTGALLLYRKAIDLYDPESHPHLAEVYEAVTDCELRQNHPVAARAALQMAMKHLPADLDIRNGFESLFGPETRFPAVAVRDDALQSVTANAPPERQAVWKRALAAAATGKLADAVKTFEQITNEDADSAPAWFNLALVSAWQGDNAKATAALEQYVGLEADENKAAEAWALAEVLRCGRGMEDQSDYVVHSAIFPMRNPQEAMRVLGELSQEGRMTGHQVNEEQGTLTAALVEKPPAFTAEHAAAQLARLAAYLVVSGNMMRVWNVNKEAFDRIADELHQRGGGAFAEPHRQTEPSLFLDIHSEALAFPSGATSEQDATNRIRGNMERYYEETWIHHPRKSLSGVAPVDATGHGTLRKKLRGVIQFLDECMTRTAYGCSFDRLRRKLGLMEALPETAAATGSARDFSALGAAELAGLNADSLPDVELEQALDASLKLDARELAGHFANVLFARPPRSERTDRFPWCAQLAQKAQAAGDLDAALEFVTAGEKDDGAHNEGRRRDDYQLRRAQLHTRRGELEQAQVVFDGLIDRLPAELRFRVAAAEAMLSAKQPQSALRYAEAGLARARQQNDRDSEGHFQELLAAAKR